MRTTVKTYCILMLLMLTFSISSAAVNQTGMADIEAAACCEASTFTSLEYADSVNNVGSDERDLLNDTHSAWASDMETGGKSISESFNINFQRIRRAEESTSFLRYILLVLSQRQNSLVLEHSKQYYLDKGPHYASFSSEYYIYTLRQILI